MLPARTPTRREVRRYVCPRCGARPGDPCRELATGFVVGVARRGNHRERVEAATAWKGRQLRIDLAVVALPDVFALPWPAYLVLLGFWAFCVWLITREH